jgi:hypothetical protein
MTEGEKMHAVPSGATVSGAVLRPCPDVTPEQRGGGLEAGATAQRARATASVIPAAESFAVSRQLDAPRSEPSSETMAYVRMIRPFPTRRLAEVLHQVLGTAALIDKLVVNAQIEPPRSPDVWTETLSHILTELDLMHDIIEEAVPQITVMVDEADHVYERSLSAVRALLAGADGG